MASSVVLFCLVLAVCVLGDDISRGLKNVPLGILTFSVAVSPFRMGDGNRMANAGRWTRRGSHKAHPSPIFLIFQPEAFDVCDPQDLVRRL